jgi:hypothetical protein
MNMYSIGGTAFNNINNKSISAAYDKAAQVSMSMKNAADEILGDIYDGPSTQVFTRSDTECQRGV